MTLSFPNGDELPWIVPLNGSTVISDTFGCCDRDLTDQVQAVQPPANGAPAVPGATQSYAPPSAAALIFGLSITLNHAVIAGQNRRTGETPMTEREGKTVLGRMFPPRDAWLVKASPKATIDPDLPIIDTHHHLWPQTGDARGEPGLPFGLLSRPDLGCRGLYLAR